MRFVICLMLMAISTQACLWDRDTIKDELKNNASVYDVIMGQFYHHGKAYYTAKKKQYLKELQTKKADLDLLNDLAVAHIRLEEFDKAKKVLGIALEKNRNYYKTLSNIGVMYKKTGDYKRAVDFTTKALSIKKEGHLGLGDWYLKMLEFRKKLDKKKKSSTNFLGEKYKDREYVRDSRSKTLVERIKKLLLLVKNDQTFADGYFVLGDALLHKGELNLALRAFYRAKELKHHNMKLVEKRIHDGLEHYVIARRIGEKKLPKYKPYYAKKIVAENKGVLEWQDLFTQIEEALIEKGAEASFENISKVMKAKKISKYRPKK